MKIKTLGSPESSMQTQEPSIWNPNEKKTKHLQYVHMFKKQPLLLYLPPVPSPG